MNLNAVLTSVTRRQCGKFEIVYRTRVDNALRRVQWLTEDQANGRARALRRRGYKVEVRPMR